MANKKSLAQELIARDAANISPSYTRSYPFVMAKGRGSEVWDVDGKRYIDFATGIAVGVDRLIMALTGAPHIRDVQAIHTSTDPSPAAQDSS